MNDGEIDRELTAHEEFRRHVGTHWRWVLVALTAGCFLAGWLALLFDPDTFDSDLWRLTLP